MSYETWYFLFRILINWSRKLVKNNNYYCIEEVRGLMSKELVINQEELEEAQYIRELEEFSKIDTSLS